MIVVKNAQKKKFKPNKTTCVFEFDLKDKDLGGATALIKGRYPDFAFVVNQKVKQLVYVISGSGGILTPDGIHVLNKGDMVFIDKGEKFAWDGSMELFIANAPRFNSAQYKQTE